MIKKIIKSGFILTIVALQLSSCGGKKGRSSDIVFAVLPKTPIIINADAKEVDNVGNIIVIPKPWMGLKFYIKNNSDQTLIIPAISIKTRNFNKGAIVDKTTDIGVPNVCDPTQGRVFFAVVAPGGEWREDGLCNPDSTAWASGDLQWKIGGLGEADSFNYSVQVTPQGYFESSDGLASERFVKTVTFGTK